MRRLMAHTGDHGSQALQDWLQAISTLAKIV
jgi:hypothetical protein